jgi:SAM-dependent methyltransferase
MKSIREYYNQLGVEEFYKTIPYSNPHEKQIIKLIQNIEGNKVLDLCCGTGLVTKNIKYKEIEGIDPYLYNEYEKNTGKRCIRKTFKDIVQEGLDKYDLIICSFGLHLCEASMLPMLMYRIKESTNRLIVISPSKHPKISNKYKETIALTLLGKRIHMREYLF